ncbi:beta-glucosidase BglX [Salipaludibacillus keqinensis]|uniref:beta-glucosidase n=1 Tax=Salipaludibacillus keqinensis TaxID=2045207 RepID=A0A323TCF9_9BACI|nr:beta-glucosidase BglX [Salipaludibacillus keqinensis]PYZ92689.1 beta-glucosidase BglX [Salipaludibacillus keqinensis]
MKKEEIIVLLNKMTLEEKIGQLLQLATPFFEGAKSEGEITGPLAQMGVDRKDVQYAGSVLGASGTEEVQAIQKAYLEKSRLNIPLLVMADVVHGYETIFPVPLAIGCSWDIPLAQKSAEVAAKEASASGIHVTFAPMVDLVRDPRWGRVMESTGEDPYLNSEFAKAFVKGFQGEDYPNNHDHVAACVKHFAAYGAPEGGRDYNTVDMSERQLREYYLPAYKAALNEGCEMVMTAFNTVDGIPATGNRKLMRSLLREEWNFEGVLISDWGAVKEMIPHGVAADDKEAALKAIEAGVDIEMMTSCYVNHLKELIENDDVSEEILDQSVLRILTLKNKLGLFEDPYRSATKERETETVFSERHRELAREQAAKSCVLLKNENILPLKKTEKLAVIGPFANSKDILGPWSWKGKVENAVSLIEGMKNYFSTENLNVAEGCGIEAGTDEEMNEAVAVAKESDIVVLALGESSDMSGEAGSLADIRLPDVQRQLVKRIKEVNKKIVVVLFNGRPLDLDGMIDEVDAILEAWYPGTEGGAAIAELLVGKRRPSGRLTMSFPYSVGQIPVYYNSFNTGRPKGAPNAQERYVSQYLDIPNEPLYPFGYGLSYTSFQYHEAILSSQSLTSEGSITLSVKVENTGDVTGEEVVQMYIRDVAGEVVRPLKELKGFEKIALEPGEARTVEFSIEEKDLRYHHSDLIHRSDEGEFIAYVGPNSRDVKGYSFSLKNR